MVIKMLRWSSDLRHGLAVMTLALALTLFGVGVKSQIPAICSKNATLYDAVCCPTPPGFSELCGGEPRGRCTVIMNNNEDYMRAAPETGLDDRIHWPLRLFRYGCECEGNLAGYMCHECSYGFTGQNCSEKIVRVRRDFKTLNSTEKTYIIDLFEKARSTQSDYLLIDVSKGADPVHNISFLPASVYDYLAYVHFYASRKTFFRSDSYPGNQTDFKCDMPHFSSLDFAHKGPNFPLWHRYYMILWEKEFQKLSGDIQFTFPYWNWTDAGQTCDVCTEDFLGATNLFGQITKRSRIHNWYGLCVREEGKCEACDPRKRYVITRNPGKVKYAPALPTSATVNMAMAADVYDLPGYDMDIPNASFRGCLEGFAGTPQEDVYRLHNEVHMFFGGLLNSATSASWDPIFYFHHSFMDKLLETWLRRTGAQPTQLPLTDALPGHHRNSRLMAFFPTQESSLYFRSSTNLGYTYDDMMDDHEGHVDNPVKSPPTRTSPSSTAETTTTTTPETESNMNGKNPWTNFDKHRRDHDPDLAEVVSKSKLLTIVVIESAILVVVLLVAISACVEALSRRRRMYIRLPSEDSFEDDLDSIAHVRLKRSPSLESFSDSEIDNLKR